MTRPIICTHPNQRGYDWKQLEAMLTPTQQGALNITTVNGGICPLCGAMLVDEEDVRRLQERVR